VYLLNRYRGIACFLLLLIVSGCSGFEPYTPTNQREEGLETGLFSGSDGGFVIYQKGDDEAAETPGKIKAKEAESVGSQGGN